LEADSVTADIIAASAENLITFCPGDTQTQRDLKIVWGLREYQYRKSLKVQMLQFAYTAVSCLLFASPNNTPENRERVHNRYQNLFNKLNRIESSDRDNKTIVSNIEKQYADEINLYNLMFK
jgi:hypothetical protein